MGLGAVMMASGCIVGGLINLTVLLWSSTSVLVTGRCGLSCREGLLCDGGTRSHHFRSGDGFCSLSVLWAPLSAWHKVQEHVLEGAPAMSPQ